MCRIEDNKHWKIEDHSELERLYDKIIQIHDTEIGIKTKKVVDNTLAVLQKMSKYQQIIIRNEILSSP